MNNDDTIREIILSESEFQKVLDASKPENIEKMVKKVREFRKQYKERYKESRKKGI